MSVIRCGLISNNRERSPRYRMRERHTPIVCAISPKILSRSIAPSDGKNVALDRLTCELVAIASLRSTGAIPSPSLCSAVCHRQHEWNVRFVTEEWSSACRRVVRAKFRASKLTPRASRVLFVSRVANWSSPGRRSSGRRHIPESNGPTSSRQCRSRSLH